jgi:nitrogen fixation protein NifU and related proteins
MPYSELVMQHAKNPRNVGHLDSPDGVGEVGNPVCGDMMTIMIKVKDDRVEDIKFETFGCGAAIAVSSIVTELAKGKTLREALQINREMLEDQLGDLPKNELHCSNLGADALHKAIMNYYERKEGRTKKVRGGKVAHEDLTGHHCFCPYCQVKLPGDAARCSTCGNPTQIEKTEPSDKGTGR